MKPLTSEQRRLLTLHLNTVLDAWAVVGENDVEDVLSRYIDTLADRLDLDEAAKNKLIDIACTRANLIFPINLLDDVFAEDDGDAS